MCIYVYIYINYILYFYRYVHGSFLLTFPFCVFLLHRCLPRLLTAPSRHMDARSSRMYCLLGHWPGEWKTRKFMPMCATLAAFTPIWAGMCLPQSQTSSRHLKHQTKSCPLFCPKNLHLVMCSLTATRWKTMHNMDQYGHLPAASILTQLRPGDGNQCILNDFDGL